MRSNIVKSSRVLQIFLFVLMDIIHIFTSKSILERFFESFIKICSCWLTLFNLKKTKTNFTWHSKKLDENFFIFNILLQTNFFQFNLELHFVGLIGFKTYWIINKYVWNFSWLKYRDVFSSGNVWPKCFVISISLK